MENPLSKMKIIALQISYLISFVALSLDVVHQNRKMYVQDCFVTIRSIINLNKNLKASTIILIVFG